jgi:hypothetical protein
VLTTKLKRGVHYELYEGQDLFVGVNAESFPPPSFQWFQNGNKLEGETRSFLQVPDVRTRHAGAYTCQISNLAGMVTFEDVSVSVKKAPSPASSASSPAAALHGHTHLHGQGHKHSTGASSITFESKSSPAGSSAGGASSSSNTNNNININGATKRLGAQQAAEPLSHRLAPNPNAEQQDRLDAQTQARVQAQQFKALRDELLKGGYPNLNTNPRPSLTLQRKREVAVEGTDADGESTSLPGSGAGDAGAAQGNNRSGGLNGAADSGDRRKAGLASASGPGLAYE